jgi:ribonuclease M5
LIIIDIQIGGKMIKIKQAVIVEGKYDKIKLSSIIDAVIIETDGFRIFKDKEKQKLIRKLADTCGILIITDSDSAGFKIRSFICGTIPNENIYHAYIPDILGKEKRKSVPSKEGKLGVEGVPSSIIVDALTKAGILFEETRMISRRITKNDFYEDGLTGKKNSRALKYLLLKHLELPAMLSTNSLLKMINLFVTYDEYKIAINACETLKEKIDV